MGGGGGRGDQRGRGVVEGGGIGGGNLIPDWESFWKGQKRVGGEGGLGGDMDDNKFTCNIFSSNHLLILLIPSPLSPNH